MGDRGPYLAPVVLAVAGGGQTQAAGTVTLGSDPAGFRGQVGYLNAPDYPGSLSSPPPSIESGQTYSFVDFAGGVDVGSFDSPVTGVTFHGCRFSGSGLSASLANLYGDDITFDYCSFEPDTTAPPVTHSQGYELAINAGGSFRAFVEQLTVTNCDIWGFSNAIDLSGSTQAKPQVFRDCWIHDARDDGGVDHTDGIGSYSGVGSGSYITIDHCTIESVANTNGIGFQGGEWDHITVTNCRISGWGYAILIQVGTNITFTDNVYSTRLQASFGPLHDDDMVSNVGFVWARNRWSVPVGAAWGNPAHDGLFWLPVAGNSPDDDSPFVSSTDYAG